MIQVDKRYDKRKGYSQAVNGSEDRNGIKKKSGCKRNNPEIGRGMFGPYIVNGDKIEAARLGSYLSDQPCRLRATSRAKWGSTRYGRWERFSASLRDINQSTESGNPKTSKRFSIVRLFGKWMEMDGCAGKFQKHSRIEYE